jgi:arylsulfatase A-like enzyme/tetratricopeptide (TPR) repeat protein
LALALGTLVLVVVIGLSVVVRRSLRGTSGASALLNVLLISVDTVRTDHLPAYGNARIETPAISKLAREGVRFTNAYTTVPLTLPAHASILTGLQPFTHGVRDNGGFYLDASRPTLATILKSNGFQTAAFVSAFVLDSRWGLGRGFDRYFDDFTVSQADLAAMARVQRPGDETWAEARRWLDSHVNGTFFVWLHLFDPHSPYTPPEPYRTRYADRPYDGEIAYADAIVGRAIDYLDEHRLLDRTLVVLASDHGEGLGDHSEDEHGLLAYDSTLHVPWIIRLPARERAGTTVDRPVSLVDVAPTVLGLLGIAQSQTFDGTNLSPIVRGTGSVGQNHLYAETYYPRLRYNWSELVAIRDDRYKLIRAPRPELYDVRADPGESQDLAASRAALVAVLEQKLAQMTGAHANTPPAARGLDPDAARRLGSLGYIGCGGSSSTHPSQSLPNPKDKTATYRALSRARALLEKGSDREAVAALQTLVLNEPELEPARRLLREYWLDRRRTADGLAWFRAAVATRHESVPLLIELGIFERAAGQLDRSSSTFERALAMAPDSVDALLNAGETVREMGKADRALAMFQQAAAQTPDALPRMRVAETLIKMGRLSEADRVLSEALAADPQTGGAHYLLAQIAEQQHDLARAEREYRLEMSISSWDYRAPFNLASLVGARKDYAEQVTLLQSIPRIAPQFAEAYFYLAKALLDQGDRARFPEAIDAARRGLQLAPSSASAPLAHYVLADIYNLQDRKAEAQREFLLGQQLERASSGGSSPR